MEQKKVELSNCNRQIGDLNKFVRNIMSIASITFKCIVHVCELSEWHLVLRMACPIYMWSGTAQTENPEFNQQNKLQIVYNQTK